MDITYLDNNATTRLAPEALEAMMPFLTDLYGNPSSVHRFGQRVRQAVDVARSQVARFINASESEIFFTGGGTEAINTAVRGLVLARAPRQKVIITSVEHSATRELCRSMGGDGLEIITIPVDQDGKLDLDRFRESLDDSVAMVSIMWANNETGNIFPISEIAHLCRERRVPFHCDATQAAGKLPIDVKAVPVDALTLAAHKFHGPKGAGALYVRRGVRFKPLVIGGTQESSRRGGTENVPGIVGMGVAAELAGSHLNEMPRIAQLRDAFEHRVLSEISDTFVNGAASPRVANTTNIGFERLEAEAVLLLLSEQGVCASAGAACSSGSLEPSPILRAMGIEDRIAHGSIRFSLSRYSTQEEIDHCLTILPRVISRLRAVLPVGL